ncbi:MAG: anhydro-N-acetylmuramic acid kinase [Aquincola sp.]|nr:anhydro-N-acetylmuramic acid kinase [Aquincola sp.]MDH4288870.1 anhydro-N-acetylmuramic acid kinase [Aquincola sp.]MDH5330903.1 anhydro-N-acetylmuramic acid kinase [Aquincola sp.]
MARYIGLMSGTSLDGIDAVLAECDKVASGPVRVLGHTHAPYIDSVRAELLALNAPGADELHRAALAANAVARAYASVVTDLLLSTSTAAHDVRAIGAHGQTVRHQPGAVDGTGYTIQLLNGSLLAEHTRIDVVCDLRSRDVAAGGQGAPLAPAFHAAMFARPGHARAVLNLGGIANLTLLAADGSVIGFDCGPANALLDGWCQRHHNLAYDEAGRWAASGSVVADLLDALLSDAYFKLDPPKSTGRDLFNLSWLDTAVGAHARHARAEDIQATLAALTVACVVRDLRRHAADARALYVCGGGARNAHVMALLAQALPGVDVQTTGVLGLPVDQVEAAAFAWLACCFVEGRAGNVPAVTGALGPRRLGALHPAR